MIKNSNNSIPKENVKRTLFIITSLLIITVLITSFCKKRDLELEASYKIKVKEPSGLAINDAGNVLYTVGDKTSKIYKLSIKGEVLKKIECEGNNLEGVSTFTSNKLLLAEEGAKTIIVFDLETGQGSNHKIKYKNKDKNSGIEGVSYDQNSEIIFIVNEKNPGKLIKLRKDFTVLAKFDLDFAHDYSGIFYEDSSKLLWILSDQNKTVNKCTVDGKLIESFKIDVKQAEGIAIKNEHIYIVSDVEAKLYIFKKP